MRRDKLNIVFLWPELPDYAARCLGALRQSAVDFDVNVVATKPSVPIQGMEASFGKSVKWLEKSISVGWQDLALNVPDVLFVGGYSHAHFERLELQARDAGAKIVLMSDNAWVSSLRQRFVEPLRHRLLYRWRYDAVIVPGAAGVALARKWGYQERQINTGLYGSDHSIFRSSSQLREREKSIVFVGQLIKRKNVELLCKAFAGVSEQIPEWSLTVYGSGELSGMLPHHTKISYHDFLQPVELSNVMRNARCLALLSSSEHWGLVVHEAALSGCALLLSDRIGARHDLAAPANSIICSIDTIDNVRAAFLELAGWTDEQWSRAQECSLTLSQGFGPQKFAQSVQRLVCDLVV